MAGITEYLKKILSSVYGRDVRQAIHDAIQQCYTDAAGELKVDKNQGKANAGKILGIGNDGAVKPVEQFGVAAKSIGTEELADHAVTEEKLADEINKKIDQNISDVTELKDDLSEFVVERKNVTPSELKYGGYDRNGIFILEPNYYSSEKISLDGVAIGSKIKLKASLSTSSQCVVLFDEQGFVLDYLCSENATERGYEITSVIKPIEIEALEGSAYIVTVIRSAFFTSLEKDMTVTYDKANYKLADGSVTSRKLADGSVTSRKLADGSVLEHVGETGKNKLDESKSVYGYLYNDTGRIYDSASYLTSDFIDISNFNKKICVSPKTRKSLQYNDFHEPISGTYTELLERTILDIADGASYIRVSYFAEDIGKMQLEDSDTITTFEPYGRVLNNSVNALNEKTKSALSEFITESELKGKKWYPFGDSFTDYTNKNIDNGLYRGKNATYPRLIATRTGIVIDEHFFRSGRTMAYPSDHTFTNSATCPTCDGYYQNVPTDADYITIMLGINDLNHQNGVGVTPDGEDATGVIKIGTIDDTDTSTYCGAYNTVLSWFRENRPYAHIGIIITNGTQRQDFTEAQIAIAKKWGYPYLNLNGDERTPAFVRCYNPNMSQELRTRLMQIQGVNYPSDTHPNWQTHEVENTIIEAFLRSL